jgi:hypothetical protein
MFSTSRTLLVVMMMGVAAITQGAPVLSVDSVAMRPGQSTNLVVRLAGGTEGYAGVNTVLWLPSVLSIQSVASGPLIPTNTFSFYYTVSGHGSGTSLALVAAAVSNVMGSAGIICTVSVTVALDVLPGSYPLVFASTDPAADVNACHALSNSNGLQSVSHGITDGSIGVTQAPGPGDSNGNGIPDVWEVRYFGGLTNISSTTDADHDGLSDYYECLAGTNPTNAASWLAVAANSTLPATGRAMVLRWYSIPGTVYDVQCSSNLANVAGWVTIEEAIPATPPINVQPVNDDFPKRAKFYRIKAR